jgi:cell division septation protein DedD
LRKPEAQHDSAAAAPIPGRKPDFAAESPSQPSSVSPPSAGFVVQLASVKTRDGARREWRKLQSRFPEALSGMDLKLHEIELSQRGTVIRVRTGPFSGFSEAVDFCAQIRTVRQDCLVVRTSGEN